MPENAVFNYMEFFWYIFGIILVGVAYKFGKFWVSSRLDTKASLKMRLDDMTQESNHYKKLAQQWRGRCGNMTARPTVANGDPEDPETFIPNLVKSYGHMAPDWLKPFLKDENMIRFIVEEAKKHPDAAKTFLTQFVGKPTGPKPQETTQIDEGQYA